MKVNRSKELYHKVCEVMFRIFFLFSFIFHVFFFCFSFSVYIYINIYVIISENFFLLRFYIFFYFSLLSKSYMRVGGWAKKVKNKIH